MSTFGRDTPMDRPSPGGRAAVFVPVGDAEEAVATALKNGSGMAGFGNADGSVTVYFENNKFNDSALHPWQCKVFKAYDRMVKGSPTVNKLTCDAGNLIQVGFVEGPEILVRDMPALHAWLERCNTLDSAPATAEIHS
jgi:propanediol dehydratase large subunit